MIIKQPGNEQEILVLEAVSSGVRLVNWKDLAKITGASDDKWFDSICFRKVNFERTDYVNERFIEFANQTIGSKYEISL